MLTETALQQSILNQERAAFIAIGESGGEHVGGDDGATEPCLTGPHFRAFFIP
jgi:hypothetical protein